jgi:threonine dehydratase
VVAFSSGNHAQAIALSGKLLGIKTGDRDAARRAAVKLEATRGYGAEVVQYTRHEIARRWPASSPPSAS